MTDKPPVILIDLSNIFWSAWHSSGEDVVSQARSRALTMIQRAIGDNQGALVGICCDSGKSFRKDLLPEYKANRPEKDHNALGELDALKGRLLLDGHLLWSADTFEADDIIATATIAAVKAGHEVLIVSADKDILQLLRPGVRALRIHNWSTVGVDEVREKFGVEPEQLGDWLALVGDKGDNVNGAPGIGPKRATDLMGKFYSLSGLWNNMDSLAVKDSEIGTPAVVRSLMDNRRQVELARRIVELRYDAPITFTDIYERREPQKLTEEKSMSMEPQAELTEGRQDPEVEYDVRTMHDPVRQAALANAQAQATMSAQEAAVVQAKASTALVKAEVVLDFERQLEPRSLATAATLAEHLYNSRLYVRFPTKEAILAVIVRGREMGLGALTALDAFHVIEGRPSPSAHLIIDLASRHPDCEFLYCEESTAEKATWVTKHRRNPQPQRLTYTLEQAKASGLVKPGASGKPNQWMVRPDELCRKTAGVQLARMVYPGAALCLYAFEELGGEA